MKTRLKPAYIAFISLLLILSTYACGASMKKPDIKLNPNPRMRYEITMTIHGAPGPFDRIEGSIDYKVGNPASVPLTPFSGATVEPQRHETVEFRKVGENVYKAEIYADMFLDEDYFGQGVCHWVVEGLSADLIVGSHNLSPAIFRDDIFSGATITRYFANISYTFRDRSSIDIGSSDPKDYKRPDDTFSVTLSSTESFP
ncbi:hypothetical protein [Luteibacter sp.]|jgi:hypothetical protein|uniref:hypothetical protein n=1 Tax=Luteibacter sp. TaxID=1886636 RepID=UPI002F417E5D